MIPTRVTAPSAPLVSLQDLKQHLNVDFEDDDALIQSLEKSAVAHLDGWRGILGRCIQQQTWSVKISCAGCHPLPFPDVSEVAADTGEAELSQGDLGSRVLVTEPCTVTMTVSAPPEVAEISMLAVKMLVAHWYHNREAVTGSGVVETPLAVDRILAPIRWTRL